MRHLMIESKGGLLGQVLTPPKLANRLATVFSGGGKAWLELGVGSGRIASACVSHHSPVSYLGVEIDPKIIENGSRFPCVQYLESDVLDVLRLKKALGKKKFDCVIGNPPYGRAKFSEATQARLMEMCPAIIYTKGWGQLDLYFVLESLARLKRPGEAAFIVSSTLALDSKLHAFRQMLISEAAEIECYELPLTVFEGGVEVKSCMLVARFGVVNKGKCKVIVGRMEGENFDIVEQRKISPELAAISLDFSYHKFIDFDLSIRNRRGCTILKDLGVSIVRGSKTRSAFNGLGVENFHTPDFPLHGAEICFTNGSDERFNLAQEGDILIPRVGSRCLDRQAIVTSGSSPFTDSIYRLQLPLKNRQRVLNWMSSANGTVWRQSVAKGSCAKYLTITDLLSMPIPLR